MSRHVAKEHQRVVTNQTHMLTARARPHCRVGGDGVTAGLSRCLGSPRRTGSPAFCSRSRSKSRYMPCWPFQSHCAKSSLSRLSRGRQPCALPLSAFPAWGVPGRTRNWPPGYANLSWCHDTSSGLESYLSKPKAPIFITLHSDNPTGS